MTGISIKADSLCSAYDYDKACSD